MTNLWIRLLTFNILYNILGCKKALFKIFGKRKLDKFFDTAAANIYSEVQNKKIINAVMADIFSEQIFVCSMLGIVDCLHRKNLYNVVKYVSNNGCIKIPKKYKRVRRKDVSIGNPTTSTKNLTGGGMKKIMVTSSRSSVVFLVVLNILQFKCV